MTKLREIIKAKLLDRIGDMELQEIVETYNIDVHELVHAEVNRRLDTMTDEELGEML